MKRSKKVFIIVGIIFLILLIYASYDISQRTTFPGSKPQLRERIKRMDIKNDSTKKGMEGRKDIDKKSLPDAENE